MIGELAGETFVGDVGLGDDEQPRRVLVDAVDDAGAGDAADARQAAVAMVEERVDQRAVEIARGGMDDQPGRLVDDEEMLVLIGDDEGDILRLVMRRAGIGDGEDIMFVPADFRGRIADEAVGAVFVECGKRARADEGFKPFARDGREGRGEGAVEAPAGVGGVERDVMDMLPPGHELNLGRTVEHFNGKLAWLRAIEMPRLHEAARCPIDPGMDAVELASLLCSRLCHDLLSPIGALNNGVELLADETDPEMRERCMELLADSARASANKLKFFRLAFGAAGGFGEDIDTREAKSAIEGLYGPEKRIELGWMVAGDRLPKSAVKLLLNLAMLAGDALVRGGTLDIGAEQREGEVEVVIRAEGPRILLDPSLRAALTGVGTGAVEARAAGAWLAHRLASDAGGSVRLSDAAEPVLLIGATLPTA